MTVERTAEEWGRVAVSLPGWRWMPGMLAHGPMGAWRTGEAGALKGSWPDPDDPATGGCMAILLTSHTIEPSIHCGTNGFDIEVFEGMDGLFTVSGNSLGRACIAAAEALGRWPGGGA